MYDAPRIKSQEDLLSEATRKAILDILMGSDCDNRRKEAYKRQDFFRDDGKKYVEAVLKDEIGSLKAQTLMHRIPNVSILKKIVKKLARVYKEPPKRIVLEESARENLIKKIYRKVVAALTGQIETHQAQVEYLVDMLNLNLFMKKLNRMVKLHRTMAVRIFPRMDASTGRYRLMPEMFHPGQFDAIVTDEMPTVPIGFVFITEMPTTTEGEALRNSQADGRSENQRMKVKGLSMDPSKVKAVWWSDKYHFTTNGKGEVINAQLDANNQPNMLNPLENTNIIAIHDEQDDTFWSKGGKDLTDGTALFNLLLADLYYTAKFQANGILVVTGENIPNTLEISADDFVRISDPKAEVSSVTTSPNFQAIMGIIEELLALILSTNDLEPSTVSGKLDATKMASGVDRLLSQAEVTESIADEHETYRDSEPRIFQMAARSLKFASTGGRQLDDDFAPVASFPEQIHLSIRYQVPKPVVSEKEKLEDIKQRRELLLDSEVDSIMRDNPEMDEKSAEERLKKIFEKRAMVRKMMQEAGIVPAEAEEGGEEGDPKKGKKPPVPAGKEQEDADE